MFFHILSFVFVTDVDNNFRRKHHDALRLVSPLQYNIYIKGRRVRKSFQIPFFITLLIVLFQNCSNEEGTRSGSYFVKPPQDTNALIADVEMNDTFSAAIDDGSLGTADPSVPFIDPEVCYRDYVSVFAWNNPSADLMDEPPVVGRTKISSIKVSGDYSSAAVTSGWRIENILKTTSRGTQLIVKFLKSGSESSHSLNCYLVRFSAQAELDSGVANVLYSNLGLDTTANLLTGFLRNTKQYIACKVSGDASESIEIVSSEGSSTVVSSNQPFILKRGCYQ